jgi:hypothetical protein
VPGHRQLPPARSDGAGTVRSVGRSRRRGAVAAPQAATKGLTPPNLERCADTDDDDLTNGVLDWHADPASRRPRKTPLCGICIGRVYRNGDPHASGRKGPPAIRSRRRVDDCQDPPIPFGTVDPGPRGVSTGESLGPPDAGVSPRCRWNGVAARPVWTPVSLVPAGRWRTRPCCPRRGIPTASSAGFGSRSRPTRRNSAS